MADAINRFACFGRGCLPFVSMSIYDESNIAIRFLDMVLEKTVYNFSNMSTEFEAVAQQSDLLFDSTVFNTSNIATEFEAAVQQDDLSFDRTIYNASNIAIEFIGE